MESRAIHTAGWIRALCVAWSALALFGGVATLVGTRGEAGGWLALFLFGGGGLAIMWWALFRQRSLSLEPEGIRDRTFGLVLWADIAHASVYRPGLDRFLELKVREPQRYFERLSRWRRRMWKVSRRTGLGYISFNITGLRIGSDELVRIVQERAGRATSPK